MMQQTFTSPEVSQLVFLVAELTEHHPELLADYYPETKAVAYKALSAAPANENGLRNISITLVLNNPERRGW